ncbi:multi antimicrobial extrusion protein MatE [Neobacillus cucumis]|uniref:multi antimicrobial extrusion protein MatE n=1 Tax=Neobacillus cucumis TaxID=1740721 RepID=UPI00203A8C56|nr:multi antimicrobial extrusion protein MatE [Neobacillus cucumis]MCM3728053.1 multi antimicrobial extrusion protein MatE [Neobacillus cucumis]
MKTEDSVRDYGFAKILLFFIPLALSASLTSVSHVIINGTLSRAEHAEIIIANYAIALSLFSVLERPAIVFRQTTSALAKGNTAFFNIAAFFVKISFFVSALCALIGFTRIGDWVFIYGFNADADSLTSLKVTFLVLAVVILFSGLRGLYQGVIINQLETKWVTLGVIIRLVVMFVLALCFNHLRIANTSVAGAVIFLAGMAIECLVSVWRGQTIVRGNSKSGKPLKQKEISAFYFPLVFYMSFQTILIPIIYSFLGMIQDVHLGIASFALAFSITNLVLSFFMYTHQVVLQFYKHNKPAVIKCVIVFSIVPSLFLGALCFTPAGPWFMRNVMGADVTLAAESLAVLKFFLIKTAIFPWVDYFGGILMLQKSTKSLLKPQICNMAAVVLVIIPLVYLHPELNGRAGAIAASFGEIIGLMAVFLVVSQRQKYKLQEHKSV